MCFFSTINRAKRHIRWDVEEEAMEVVDFAAIDRTGAAAIGATGATGAAALPAPWF